MKNLIEYYYNLNIYNLRTSNDDFLFNSHNKLYLFYKIRNADNVKNMTYILNNFGTIYMHSPIFNKESQLITYDGENYRILFLINISQNRKISYKDVLYFSNNNTVYNFNTNNNWELMWKNKIDFLENYIEKKDNINNLIKPLCYYYIGLAENSLQYLRKIRKNFVCDCSISHKRIDKDDTLIELYNPINFVIDNKCRDIGEYLRSISYSNNNFLEIINSLNYADYEFQLLYARLLFPTTFFDKIELLNDSKITKQDILSMYDLTLKYELFLNNIYNIIKKTKNINIPSIHWIKE